MSISITLPNNLRSEEEIISRWNGDISKPLVSIRCTAFNHVNYIEDAIKGFLIQETDFPIEIWIHDDASTDGTRGVIERYQAQYPRIIKSILQTENQYSKGFKPGMLLLEKCIGKYSAVCEGDDYWVDPFKLQKQATLLENVPTVDMVIHPALMINEMTGCFNVIGRYRSTSQIVPVTEIITKKFGQIPTASTFVRSSIHDKLKLFNDRNPYLTVGDIYLHIFGASRGGVYYLDEVSSVYRLLTPGSWTSRQFESPIFRANHIAARIISFNALKAELPQSCHGALNDANKQSAKGLFWSSHFTVCEKLNSFRKFHSVYSGLEKLSPLLISLVPSKILKFISLVRSSYL